MTTLVDITLPIRTKNPLNGATGNSKLAAILRTKRRAEESAVSYMALAGRTPKAKPGEKFVATLTRMSSKPMDDDGLAASFKAIRDSVAKALGIDDGDTKRLQFRYAQSKTPPLSFGIRIVIEVVQ